jgi:hypothetical protein
MNKQMSPARMALRVLAGKVEMGTLDDAERRGLAKLLRALGDGKTVDEFFDIKTPAHRVKGTALEQRIFDVEVLRLPIAHGGENMSKKDAIAKVAQLNRVEIGTIEEDYKSARGKAIREQVKATYFNPLADTG